MPYSPDPELMKDGVPHGIIYLLLNVLTAKPYVGLTTTHLSLRVNNHLYESRKPSVEQYISMAIKKHGIKSFVIVILERPRLQDLSEREVFWISKFKSMKPNGYNLTTGGERPVMSEETRRKISEANRKRPKRRLSDEAKYNIKMAHVARWKRIRHDRRSEATRGERNPFYGRKHTPETIQRLKSLKAGKNSGANNPFYGKTHSAESVAKWRASKYGARSAQQPELFSV